MTGSGLIGGAEELAGPARVVGRAGHLGHELIGGEALQVRWWGAVAQRLERVMDGPY